MTGERALVNYSDMLLHNKAGIVSQFVGYD